MDEPREVAIDASYSDEIAAHVREIVASAEHDAASIAAQAEAEAEAPLEEARAEARRLHDQALREVEAAATSRIRRLLEIRLTIAARAGELIDLASDPAETRGQIEELLDTLTNLADRIAREVDPAGEQTLARMEKELLGPEPAAEPAPAPRRFARRAPAANGGVTQAELATRRLGALRMAVAGATREELEEELAAELDGDSVRLVLDDVFGSGRGLTDHEKAALAHG
jgi:hypothetical protein